MAKRNSIKKDREQKKFIFFLVEGESDILALETPLSELIFEKYPNYEVGFLTQQVFVNPEGKEFDVEDEDSEDDEFITEDEYKSGGDITSNQYAKPETIERMIYHRFILPAVKSGRSIYPKNIARIIQITDLDGSYISDDCIKPLSDERVGHDGPFYNADLKTIETEDIDHICKRNMIKRANIDYLLSLTNTGIKLKTKTVPYEIYFFSSNMDHFINRDANVEGGKRKLAERFLRSYGLDTEAFCDFFLKDEDAVGKLGYSESWDMIREGTNSISRYTNIDYLVRQLLER